ncbi:MAG: Ig-like domain-containing protein [Gemmatimonadaceae bacterium]
MISEFRMRAWTTVTLAFAAACGGGGDGVSPPPTPVVTTVEISPSSATVDAGATLPLTATVKDQTGAAMGGQTVSWNSSAPAVATVSSAGIVSALTAGSTTVTASVGSKNGSASIAVVLPPKVVLDAGRATSASVGAAGGTLTATSSAGLTYELRIPPLALDTSVNITLAPLKAFNRLPLSGGLVGAVEFQPAGLTFRAPATLVIKTSPNVPSNQRLVGFSFGTAGDALAPKPASTGGGQVSVLVSHFSGAGAGIGTVQDLAALPPAPNSSAQDTALIALSALLLPADQAAILAALRHWQGAIVNRLQLANTDVLVRDARAEYDAWFAQINLYPGPDGAALRALLTPELNALRVALTAAFGRGIAFANQQCSVQKSIVAARNVLFLQALAESDSVAGSGSPAERSSVLSGLCVHLVVVDSLLPPAPVAGVATSLDLRLGFGFTGTPATVLFSPVRLALDVHGTTADRAFGAASDALGRLSLSLTPTGSSVLRVGVQACPDSATFGFTYPCISFDVIRGFGRTITGNVVVQNQAQLAALNDVSRITGNLSISGAQVTSTDLSELQLLQQVDGNLVISNVASLQTVGGLRNMTRVGGSLTLSQLKVGTLTGLEALTTVGGTLSLTTLSSLTSVAALSHLASVGTFQMVSAPLVTTLGPLTHMAFGSLMLQSMDGLTSLSGLTWPGAQVTGDIRLISNKTLDDLSVLVPMTSVSGMLEIRGNPRLVNLDDFGALTQVGGDLTVGGAGLLTVTGLTHVQSVGGNLRLLLNDLDALGRFEISSLTRIGNSFQVEQQRSGASPPPPNATPLTVVFNALTRVGRGSIGVTPGVTSAVRLYDLSMPNLSGVDATATGIQANLARGLHSLLLGSITVNANQLFEVDHCDELVSLTVGDLNAGFVLNLDNNPVLQSVQMGDLTADVVNVDHNNALTSWRVRNVQAPSVFNLDHNPLLATFTLLRLNAGVVNIDHNASIPLLAFNSGIVTGTMNIDHNDALSSITGTITSVGQNLNINNNLSLSNALATSWANSVAVGGLRQVTGNKSP